MAQPIESGKTAWTVPRQPAALTAFKVIGVAVSSALFATLSGGSQWAVRMPTPRLLAAS